jgi:hypothetical protein
MVVEIGLACVHQIQMSRILVRTSEPCVEQRPTGDRSICTRNRTRVLPSERRLAQATLSSLKGRIFVLV